MHLVNQYVYNLFFCQGYRLQSHSRHEPAANDINKLNSKFSPKIKCFTYMYINILIIMCVYVPFHVVELWKQRREGR